MEAEIITLFIILFGAFVLFVSGWVSVDITALIVMVSLMVTGILTPEEGVSGFSNTATLTVLALLILSEGLKNTGAVDALGDRMVKMTGRFEWSSLIVIMCIGALASAFINTTAVVAVFIPVMYRISKSTGIKVSTLLMPLSFAAMVGGASTMIGTSTNLLINAIGQSYGLPKFRIFDLTMMGGILFLALIAYMLFVGRFMLRKRSKNVQIMDHEIEIKNYLTEVLIPDESGLIGKSLENNNSLTASDEFKILSVIRENATHPPVQINKLAAGDILVIKTNIKEILRLNKDVNVQILSKPKTNSIDKNNKKEKEDLKEVKEELDDAILFEALITSNSNLIDQKIKNINFSRYYNAFPLAVRKSGFMGQQKLMDHKIKFGDILLMDGDVNQKTFYSSQDWITIQKIVKETIEKTLYRRDKLAISIFILLVVILLAVSSILPILISAWLGVVLMVITRCISLKKAYENIEWKVVFLLAGLIPLGAAMAKTGADELIANSFIKFTWGSEPVFVISLLFIFTTLLTSIVSNQATAILLVPIAIKIGASLSIPAEPLVIAILFGANTSFLTPVGYQTNAMIYGPGNYRFIDFIKVGGILCVIFWVLVTFFIPKLYL